MKSFWKTLLKGLAAVLPFLITLYIVLWILSVIESVIGGFIKILLPDKMYITGMGVVGAVGLLYAIGRLIEKRQIIHRLSDFLERQLEKVPVVKTIYSSARDLMHFFSFGKDGDKGPKQVVLVTLEDKVERIGFITGEATKQLGYSSDEDMVAVFIPMSYQMGGFLVYVPRSSLTPVDMSVEEAMQVVLTAGMSKQKKK
jgi:uncharacterized membrane protein